MGSGGSAAGNTVDGFTLGQSFLLAAKLDETISDLNTHNAEQAGRTFANSPLMGLKERYEILGKIYSAVNGVRFEYSRVFSMFIWAIIKSSSSSSEPFSFLELCQYIDDPLELTHFLYKGNGIKGQDVISIYNSKGSPPSFIEAFGDSDITFFSSKWNSDNPGEVPSPVYFPKTTPERSIVEDNPEDFQQRVKVVKEFDSYKMMPHKLRFQNKSESFLELACRCGSSRCFGLMFKGATYEMTHDNQLLSASIDGGNMKIVKVFQIRDSKNAILVRAIQSHRISIFMEYWKTLDKDEKIPFIYDVYAACIKHANYHLFKVVFTDKNMYKDLSEMELQHAINSYNGKETALFPNRMKQ